MTNSLETENGLPKSNELELVARLRSGDNDAYLILFRTHGRAMHAVAQRYFADTNEASEAVQDAFVSAFKSIGNFKGTSGLGTWLHRITVNASLQKLRRQKRSKFVPLIDLFQSSDQTSSDELMQAYTVARVRSGIHKLPDAYQEVIQMRDLEGLDTGETARRLGTTEGAVKTRLHRARQALQSILAPLFVSLGFGT